MKNLAVVWTRHLKDPEKRKEFESLVRHSTLSLGRLLDIVRDWKTALYISERSQHAYDNPNWSHKQAHVNGMMQAFSRIESLLSFLEDQDKEVK